LSAKQNASSEVYREVPLFMSSGMWRICWGRCWGL